MTQLEKLELLIGSATNFTETDFQGFLDVYTDLDGTSEQLFMAAALACERLATDASAAATSVKMGDFSETFKNNDVSYQTQASRYRDLVYNTPAWASIEYSLSDDNSFEIIRNFILRNNGEVN